MENKSKLENSVGLLKRSAQVALVITAASATAFYGCTPAKPTYAEKPLEQVSASQDQYSTGRSGGTVFVNRGSYIPHSSGYTSGEHESPSKTSSTSTSKTSVKTGTTRGGFGGINHGIVS